MKPVPGHRTHSSSSLLSTRCASPLEDGTSTPGALLQAASPAVAPASVEEPRKRHTAAAVVPPAEPAQQRCEPGSKGGSSVADASRQAPAEPARHRAEEPRTPEQLSAQQLAPSDLASHGGSTSSGESAAGEEKARVAVSESAAASPDGAAEAARAMHAGGAAAVQDGEDVGGGFFLTGLLSPQVANGSSGVCTSPPPPYCCPYPCPYCTLTQAHSRPPGEAAAGERRTPEPAPECAPADERAPEAPPREPAPAPASPPPAQAAPAAARARSGAADTARARGDEARAPLGAGEGRRGGKEEWLKLQAAAGACDVLDGAKGAGGGAGAPAAVEADAAAAARGLGDDVGAAAEEEGAGVDVDGPASDVDGPASGDEGEEEGEGEEGGAGGGAWVAGVLAEAAARGTEAEGMRAELEGFVEALRPPPRPPPLPRTNRTSLVPPLVLSGHAASLTPYIAAQALHARVFGEEGEEGEALVEFPANFPEILAAAEYAPPPPRKRGARGRAARGAQTATALCKRRDTLEEVTKMGGAVVNRGSVQ
jgi:hypothetical protein